MAIWHAKNYYGYTKSSVEGWDNIQLIYSNLIRRGFSEASACGVLVNIENESGFNPWSWENQQIMASTDWSIIDSSMVHGYGLCGWTPSGKYLHDNWSNLGLYPSSFRGFAPNYSDIPGNASDGHAQCIMIVEGQRYNWVTSGSGRVNVSWYDFRSITDPEWAAEVWCRNYEYPANLEQEVAERRSGVSWYYDRLYGTDPVHDPIEDISAPLVLLLKKAIENNSNIY